MICSRRALPLIIVLALGAPAAAKDQTATQQSLQPFDLELTQHNIEKPAWVVTSEDGNSFTKAELQEGANSPWRFSFRIDCPDGSTPEELSGLEYFDPANMREITLDWAGSERLDTRLQLVGAIDGGPVNELEMEKLSLLDLPEPRAAVLATEEDVIAACNAAVARARARQPGLGPRAALMQAGRVKPYADDSTIGQAQLKATCRAQHWRKTESGEGWATWEKYKKHDYKTRTLSMQASLPVICQSPFSRPQQADSLAAAFAVTDAWLVASPRLVKGECPHTVAFNGEIIGSGSGAVSYRIVGSDGSRSAVQQATVASAGAPAKIHFTKEIPEEASGGLSATPPRSRPDRIGARRNRPPPQDRRIVARSATPPPPGAMGELSAEAPEHVHAGWMRLEIVAPKGAVSTSEEANYKVVCTPPPIPPNEVMESRQE